MNNKDMETNTKWRWKFLGHMITNEALEKATLTGRTAGEINNETPIKLTLCK